MIHENEGASLCGNRLGPVDARGDFIAVTGRDRNALLNDSWCRVVEAGEAYHTTTLADSEDVVRWGRLGVFLEHLREIGRMVSLTTKAELKKHAFWNSESMSAGFRRSAVVKVAAD